MELIRGLHNLRPEHQGCVTTIGAFDGVHLGHRAVLQQLIDKGQELDLPTVVVVFEPLPREFFAPLQAPARLMSFREKFLALKSLGIDRILRIRFTPAFRQLDAQEFINRVFVEGLGSRHLIVGDDFRFGHDRTGNFDVLKAAGQQNGFSVVATGTVEVFNERVSSTRIRKALEESDFALAEMLLGRVYSISGKVLVGQQLGRQLDAPTANVELHRLRAAMSGVYAAEVIVDTKRFFAVANVGNRPTVNDRVKAILEVHLLDFHDDIYGKVIEVIFRKKIRDEKKFGSIDILKAQIHKDFDEGRRFFGLS
ncbi:MAG: riboflavin kinase/FMN adenylyltransferase [Oceanicoccus sp.]|jgi:riboflavin kinase/FMN adenylyltransferase